MLLCLTGHVGGWELWGHDLALHQASGSPVVSFTSDIWSSSQLASFLHGSFLLSLSEIWEQRAPALFSHPLLDCTREVARFLSKLLEKKMDRN